MKRKQRLWVPPGGYLGSSAGGYGSTGNGAYTGGGSWTRVVGLNPKPKPGGQGARHFSIVADPDDANIVYVGGDRQNFPFPNFIGANDFTGRLFRGDTTIAPTGRGRPLSGNTLPTQTRSPPFPGAAP